MARGVITVVGRTSSSRLARVVGPQPVWRRWRALLLPHLQRRLVLDAEISAQSLKALYSDLDAWVVPVICSRYGLADISTTILLVDLFEQIERQGLEASSLT